MQLTSKVTSPFRDLTLIDYLTKRFSYLSREEWLARIAEGRLLYNDEKAHAETVVRQGGRVTYDVPPFPQPDADFNYEIIYGDRWLLAINKPPNLRVHGEGKYMMANLIYHVRHVHEPPYPEATLVNRLDADTSGVVLLARQRDAARALGRLFEQREVEKRYLALVHGIPEPLEGKIDLPIGHVDNPRYRKSGRVPRIGPDAPNAKEAVTYYKTIEQFEKPAQAKSLHPSRKCALVELRPDSGRTHQLRVHMSLVYPHHFTIRIRQN